MQIRWLDPRRDVDIDVHMCMCQPTAVEMDKIIIWGPFLVPHGT